jgi:hypothetical protein
MQKNYNKSSLIKRNHALRNQINCNLYSLYIKSGLILYNDCIKQNIKSERNRFYLTFFFCSVFIKNNSKIIT